MHTSVLRLTQSFTDAPAASIFIHKMNKYFFQKPIDFLQKLWYYISVPRERDLKGHEDSALKVVANTNVGESQAP